MAQNKLPVTKSDADKLIPGQTFGALTVLGPNASATRRAAPSQYRLRCVCGHIVLASAQVLQGGGVTSCGCGGVLPAAQEPANTTSRLHALWQQIIAACDDPSHPDYAHVGSQGITVDEVWRQDFAVFYAWAQAQGYNDELWVIRINLLQGYGPENCVLVTGNTYRQYQQWSRMVTAWGETKPLLEWVLDDRCVASLPTVHRRLHQAWSAEKAINTPHELTDKRNSYRYTLTTIPVGARFGRLTVIGDYARVVYRVGSYGYIYPCRCACGTPLRQVSASNLLNGITQSCRCLQRELTSKRSRTHGERKSNSRLYRLWRAMKDICASVTHPRYRFYGGLGITVCVDWMEAYIKFRDWALSSGYQDDYYLARHDRQGDFTPENCYWSPTRDIPELPDRVFYSAFGEMKSLDDWSQDARCVVKNSTLEGRFAAGWPVEKALTTPAGRGIQAAALTIWDETKSLVEWAKDRRCLVSASLLAWRISAGWDPEEALTWPRNAQQLPPVPHPITREKKTLRDWARDSRCVVSFETLYDRVKKGWDLARALTTSTTAGQRMIMAFGETKHFAAWVADARCRVKAGTLLDRLNHQWDAERALTTPAAPLRQGRPPSPNAKVNQISVGDRFHELTVIGPPVETVASNGKPVRKYPCRCDCATETLVSDANLTYGAVKSCGCLLQRVNKDRRKYAKDDPHGIGSPLYTRWRYLRSVCQKPEHRDYPRYGGRGIRVYSAWENYTTFQTWALENGYYKESQLARRDLAADFSPGNCFWE